MYFNHRSYYGLFDSANNNFLKAKTQNLTLSALLFNLTADTETEAVKVFQDYIYPRQWNEKHYYIDQIGLGYEVIPEPTTEEVTEAKNQLLGKIYTWWINSKSYYIPLLKLYYAQKDNLLNKVGTSTTTRFNDTPQDSGTFEDDTHTTSFTEQATGSDVSPVIIRLREIRDNIETLYNEWASEFCRFSIEVK